MSKMGYFYLNFILSGYIICSFLVPVECDCQQLDKCFHDFGSTLNNFVNLTVDQQNIDKSVNHITMFLCRHKTSLVNCYDNFAGCDVFESFLSVIPNSADVETEISIICTNKKEYENSLKCVWKEGSLLTKKDLETSEKCLAEVAQFTAFIDRTSSKYCSVMEDLVHCSPVMRTTFKCQAHLMDLMENGGVTVPCINIYRQFSSGQTIGLCVILFFICCMINIVFKFDE